MQCLQFDVQSDGDAFPDENQLVAFPGAYSEDEPGLNTDVWDMPVVTYTVRVVHTLLPRRLTFVCRLLDPRSGSLRRQEAILPTAPLRPRLDRKTLSLKTLSMALKASPTILALRSAAGSSRDDTESSRPTRLSLKPGLIGHY